MYKDVDSGIKIALGRMLTTLEKKVDPRHAALIVVDVQNDFCAREGVMGRGGADLTGIEAMVPRLVKFIDKAREVGLAIIYIQAIYSSENSWYLSDVKLEQWQRRRGGTEGLASKYRLCEKNSWGADFYGGIKPLPSEVVVNKHRYSAFVDTDLDAILRGKGIRTLIMTGVETNVCVESTARDGFMKDYYIVSVRDCVASALETLHKNALENLSLYFGEVVDSKDVIKCWEKTKVKASL